MLPLALLLAGAADPAPDYYPLAVGHAWGASVYDLSPGRVPVRVRKLTGHAGYVTAIAPTHGGRGLVTAGRDHTIAFWNLADFDHQPLLGAAFAERNGQVVVEAVADGSPADEAGLAKNDVIADLVVSEQIPVVKRTRPATTADRLAQLRNARPWVELAFHDIRRPGRPNDQLQARTLVQHRPVAKFVPLRRDEWLLYTYRQCYYDSSANGDRAVQWLVSKGRADQTPDVFPVDHFRGALRLPDKVSAVLDRQQREPAKPALVDKYPPAVAVAVDKPQVRADAEVVTVTVTITPRPTPSGRQPNRTERVEVWLNGHRQVGAPAVPRDQAAGRPFVLTVQVPARSLRAGPNQVTALALAADGSWGNSGPPAGVQVVGRTDARRHLYGLSAGIGAYKPYGLENLNGATDAARLRAALIALRGVGGYEPGGDDTLPLLTDDKATRRAVLASIADVGRAAGPEDLFVLALSGHGVLGDADGNLRLRLPLREQPTDLWYLITPAHETQPLAKGDLKSPARVRELFGRPEVRGVTPVNLADASFRPTARGAAPVERRGIFGWR